LSGKRFAAVNVQGLTGRERVRQGGPHACAMSSVVPIRLAGLLAGRHLFLSCGGAD
jgi:hypothetical protein